MGNVLEQSTEHFYKFNAEQHNKLGHNQCPGQQIVEVRRQSWVQTSTTLKAVLK